MPLSPSISRRAPRTSERTRAIQIQAFAREDGLRGIDTHVNDTKALCLDTPALPIAAVQADARSGANPQNHKPFQRDCHQALRAAAAMHYYSCRPVNPLAVSVSS